jgi:prophage regulatory protein
MQSVQSSVRNALLRIEAARALTGDSRGSFYTKISQGLMVKPIKIGPRAAAVMASEVEAINGARIAGKSDDDIRELVAKLHEQRQAGA